jgi:hypothetical protein
LEKEVFSQSREIWNEGKGFLPLTHQNQITRNIAKAHRFVVGYHIGLAIEFELF